MRFRLLSFAFFVATAGISARGFAQVPFEPAQTQADPAAPASASTPSPEADVEWLTSYMLANEGYRFDDLPALEQSFEKMSPTQLRVLRQFFEQTHAMNMHRPDSIRRLQSQQTTTSVAEQQALSQYNEDQYAGPNVGDIRLEHMQLKAEANERGQLFQSRNPPMPPQDPFRKIPDRPARFNTFEPR